ncbi:hypothetical protein Tco_0706549 [Tanacetum coccineum]|uniref:Transposase (putative) gypsy type domain-containing protein n=1 Tax=Tanacetum coccineum TaxID=301880 RepID=A0ABQ4Y7P9_9ASTR
MSNITDIKSVLTQKGLDTLCQTFHIPDDVHLQLPSHNQTIHEMPAGKIGVYTRFFEYANFRLPLSTFLVNVLRYYRINLSQLSVIAAAKVYHFEILCRVHGIEPTPKKFRADDYAVLVAYPAPFWKFTEPFLCLIGMSRNYTLDEDTYPTFLHDDETEMDLLAFIHVADPNKMKVGEWECAEEEARLLDSTIGRVVPLLPIALDCADSELEASLEKFFNESGGANQGDSVVAGGGQEIKAEIVAGVSGSSYPPKKLRIDHGTLSGAASAGKSPTILKQLLASSILNVESGVGAVATLPFVTSSVSATPEHENSSHHSSINIPGAEGDSLIRSASGFHHDDRGGFHPIMYASIHSDTTPESWTITGSFPSSQETSFPWGSGVDYESFMRFLFCHCERRRLESECEKQVGLLRSKDKEIENLKAQLLFKEAEAAEKNMALEDEKKSLSGKVAELQSMISVKDRELKDVDATVTSLKSQNDGLADQVPCAGAHVRPVNERVEKLDADLAEMACHLEEKFYPHLLTTIFGRGEPFNHGLEACSSGIDPWQGTGEKLADIVAYKPSVTCGFQFCPTRALPLADAPSMGRLQHDIEQLKVPIHRSEDQVVLGGFFVICP